MLEAQPGWAHVLTPAGKTELSSSCSYSSSPPPLFSPLLFFTCYLHFIFHPNLPCLLIQSWSQKAGGAQERTHGLINYLNTYFIAVNSFGMQQEVTW